MRKVTTSEGDIVYTIPRNVTFACVSYSQTGIDLTSWSDDETYAVYAPREEEEGRRKITILAANGGKQR